jgi:hypothetical protein
VVIARMMPRDVDEAEKRVKSKGNMAEQEKKFLQQIITNHFPFE